MTFKINFTVEVDGINSINPEVLVIIGQKLRMESQAALHRRYGDVRVVVGPVGVKE